MPSRGRDASVRERARTGLVAAFLLAQALAIPLGLAQRWTIRPWAPVHEVALVRIEARLGGRDLDGPAIATRYDLSRFSFDPRTRTYRELNEARLLLERLRAMECRHPAGARAAVRAEVRRNGRPVEPWRLACPG